MYSFASFCSDLGVESGIPDFRLLSYQSLLPPWLRQNDIVSDTEVGVSVAEPLAAVADPRVFGLRSLSLRQQDVPVEFMPWT
eukprot:4840681-Alexandrium_andersonii.AAC.1